ncbi:hypothetical protein HNQ91_002128 [Filimonas zeae]|uniref:Uncharacterized protein n=1 Tax=Filimonas zeae TaxID=1737353 RepID=A0A917IVS8_9BACT|nr:hypothetical protein [Filimonas zeae]MDR6339077.1 hypothetical protein [Filimonas zeae]GGH65204.1 hypothetical protein GCM10011379_18100 [Filimonas zeae]
MQLQVEIGFDQLVQLAKRLPKTQWKKLKEEVEKENVATSGVSELEELLLSAPTFTKKQLEDIEKNRKAINQWRTR